MALDVEIRRGLRVGGGDLPDEVRQIWPSTPRSMSAFIRAGSFTV
jgi:hypothetical protein